MNDMVVIYPNPTNSFNTIQFNDEIKLEEILIEVYNLQGSLLLTFVPKGNNQNYDLSKFPNGTYLVSVRQNGKILTKKLLKIDNKRHVTSVLQNGECSASMTV